MPKEHQVNAHVFLDRKEGSDFLIEKLKEYKDQKDVVVISISRGGIVTGYWISRTLNLEMETVVVRRIMSPDNPELSLGALCEDDRAFLDERLSRILDVIPETLKETIENEYIESKRRAQLYRNGRSLPDLENKTVLLVDDGVDTGSSCIAALEHIKKKNPKSVVLVTPVISPKALEIGRAHV